MSLADARLLARRDGNAKRLMGLHFSQHALGAAQMTAYSRTAT